MEDSNFSTTHQKIAVATFLVIGMSALVLGYVKFSTAIGEPFARKGDFRVKSPEEIEKERLDFLREQDTDSDTLSDYDELYVFRTSPFIEDSDSDGILDGAEVSAGTDPNCPKGKTCRIVAATKVEDDSEIEKYIDMDKPLISSTGGATTGVSSQPAAQGESGTADDEAYVEQVLAETFGDLSQATPKDMKAKVDGMSGDELVTFLVKIGIPEEALKGKDAETLREVVSASLLEALMAAQSVEEGQVSE